ncbi:MAG: MORN repeat-containing protein [Bacillota bacterium]
MLDVLVRMFERFLRSVFIPYKSKLLSKVRSIKKLPHKFFYSLALTAKKILKAKPSSKKDYVKIRKHFVLKKVILVVLCLFLVLITGGLKLYLDMKGRALPVFSASDKNNFSGDGRVYYDNGNLKYEGSIKDGLYTGEGSLYTEDGRLYYKGSFDRNDFSGKGQTFHKNGNIKYEGDFLNGEYNGLGKLYNEASVLIYQGDFKNGSFDGQGKLFDNNGSLVYEGKFSNNEYTGFGKLHNREKNLIYQGDFKNGVYSGMGILYDTNYNKLYEGSFENGRYSGTGVESYPNQSVKYSGEFLNGYYCGSGVLYNMDGAKIYEGAFKEGVFSQNGKLYDTSEKLIYEGEFVKGKPEGLGTLYDENGNTAFKGYFKNGKVYYPGFLRFSQDELTALLGNPDRIFVSADTSKTIEYSTYKINFFLSNIEETEQLTEEAQEQSEPTDSEQSSITEQPEEQAAPKLTEAAQITEPKTYSVVGIKILAAPDTLYKKEFVPDDYGILLEEKYVYLEGKEVQLRVYAKGSHTLSLFSDTKKSSIIYMVVSKTDNFEQYSLHEGNQNK